MLLQYDRAKLHADVSREQAISVMMGFYEEISFEHRTAYAQSVRKLMAQLVASKGEPLSVQTLNELLDWHDRQFKDRVQEREAKVELERITALQALAIGGGALLAFLLIVFCFIFVKIERNLRFVGRSAQGAGAVTVSP